MRLVWYVAPGSSSKNKALSQIVRQEFAKNSAVTDEAQIQALQANAIRALSNYLVFSSAGSDPKVKQAVQNFHDRHVQTARDHQRQQKQNIIDVETTDNNKSGGK